MRKPNRLKDEDAWVELPTGIFTAEGLWFHTSESALREFAGSIVDEIGIRQLLLQAATWLKSADAAAILGLVIFLFLMPPLPALASALFLFVVWEAYSKVFVFVPLVRLFSFFSSAVFQGVLYVLCLSWMASEDQLFAAGTGLIGFILIRWGIGRKLISPLADRLSGSSSRVPPADRILHSLIVRYAISRNVTLSSTESFEKRIIEIWQRRKPS